MTKRTKLGVCPFCCPEGGAVLDRDWGTPMEVYDKHYGYKEGTYKEKRHIQPEPEEPVAVWACRNCGMETKRVERKWKTEHSPLTPSQIRAVTQIQQCRVRDEKEVKSLSVQQTGHRVFVQIVVGSKGDEGTMLAVLGRDRGLFEVGPRGGIRAMRSTDEHATKEKLAKYPLIYGWTH